MTVAELFEKEKEIIRLEYELQIQKLTEQLDYGSVGGSDWLSKQLDMTFSLIKTRILLPFRSELEGSIVSYSDKKGQPWKINKTKFNDWIVKNFNRINWEG